MRTVGSLHLAIANILPNPEHKWTNYTLSSSAAIEGDAKNIENNCDAKLGKPKMADCLKAAFEFATLGPVVLESMCEWSCLKIR